MREFIAVAKALSDENRVRILLALRDRELCVCQLIQLLGLAPSTVSRHVSVLRHASLVNVRKEGRWVHCTLARKRAAPAVSRALRWMAGAVGSSRQASEDQAQLKEILRCDLEELCKRIRGN